MDAVSLQPAAGAQGELAGVLMIRAYHEARGEKRTKVLIPDSAHGTNPASTALAGYEVIEVKSDAEGRVELGDLERHLGPDVAAFMITVPNTLGNFEPRVVEIGELLPRPRRPGLHGRRQPQRHPRAHAPRRSRLRRLPLQPAQDVHHAARRRRAGRRARSASRRTSSRSCRCR